MTLLDQASYSMLTTPSSIVAPRVVPFKRAATLFSSMSLTARFSSTTRRTQWAVNKVQLATLRASPRSCSKQATQPTLVRGAAAAGRADGGTSVARAGRRYEGATMHMHILARRHSLASSLTLTHTHYLGRSGQVECRNGLLQAGRCSSRAIWRCGTSPPSRSPQRAR